MNNTKPLVTINIVVYNGEKYLRYCLNRLKSQTYQNVEVNIVDNASTDATRRIIENGYPEFNLRCDGKFSAFITPTPITIQGVVGGFNPNTQ